MIINNTFDDGYVGDWTIFSGVNSSISIVNNKLRFANGAMHGAVLSPYYLKNRFDLAIDIILIADTDDYKESGIYFFNKEKNNWVGLYAYRSNFAAERVTPDPGSSEKTFTALQVIDYPGWGINTTCKLKIVSADCRNIDVYIDDVKQFSVDLGFFANSFALHNYSATTDYDNLVLDTDVIGISGNSKQDDGNVSRFILINDWQSGDFIKKIMPKPDGSWLYMTPNTNKLIVSHIGADGFAPRIDAPITPMQI